MKSNDFVDVARGFCPDPPDWIAEELAEYADLIHGPEDVKRTLEDYRDDLALVIALDKVQTELPPYLEPEYLDRLDDLTCDAFQDLSQAVDKVREHLLLTLGPKPLGRPRDLRRAVCAQVCANIWARCHGKSQPWSTELHAACQAYWVVCNPDSVDDRISWRNVLNGYD
jgi:hypothetical protein